MFLLEFEGKKLFKEFKIPVPDGDIATNVNEVLEIAERIGYPVVIKPQIPGGRRGRAGAIRFANNPNEAKKHAEELFKMTLYGHKVNRVLVEKKISIAHEYYLSFLIDFESRSPVLLFSPMGGIEVEELARKYPEKLIKHYIDGLELHDFEIRNLLIKAGIRGKKLRIFSNIIHALWNCFKNKELMLAEINPLAEDTNGNIWALDARVVIDENAEFRQPWITEIKRNRAGWEAMEIEAKNKGISFVVLAGRGIGTIVNGAGLAMATCDVVKKFGGEVANFLDIGGGAGAERVITAMQMLQRLGCDVILINIFGGITRCDVVAQGLVEALQKIKIEKPIVVRLTGTREEEGKQILEKAGLKAYTDMIEAIKKAVELSKKH